MLKNIFAISSLLLLFFAHSGFRFAYMIQQHLLKEEAEEKLFARLDNNEFIQIDAASGDIKWEEKGKEFFLNGEMFDVGKTEIINGKTILFCISDEKEEQLIKKLLKDISSQSDPTGNQHGKYNSCFQVQDFTFPAENAWQQPALANVALNYGEYLCFIIDKAYDINTPPPDKMQFLKI